MNKKILSVILLASMLVVSTGAAEAFSFKKNKKNNTQAVSVTKTKAPKAKKNDIEQAPYTNEVHSVFTLNDCIDNAIKYNPSIQASIYNEDVYKSKIGQAWANYFPAISAGIEVSRSGNKYTGDTPYGIRSQYTTMGYIPSVSADMLLFYFGKTKATADMAKRAYEATKEDTKEKTHDINFGHDFLDRTPEV